MAGKKQAQAWQNRIVGEGVERPDQLLANPSNWRIHPKHQQDALSAVLDNVGWVQRVIINRTTGHIVDGHLRVSLAISRNEAEVPVVYVDLTEDEELTVLATIDPLSAMAATDSAKLAELLASVQTDDAALEAVLKGVGGRNGVGDEADWQSEWQGMPEFEQEDVNAFRSIHVHFNTQDDVEEFARRISQPLPEKRNSIWFPAQADNQSMKRTRYHAD
jgi:predicted RNA binding protein with dsRBD fold (UPF0201 family)